MHENREISCTSCSKDQDRSAKTVKPNGGRARAREVGLRRSSCEPAEQRGAMILEPFTASYFQFMRRIGLKMRFHDLRHNHASQLLRASEPKSSLGTTWPRQYQHHYWHLLSCSSPGCKKRLSRKSTSH